MEWEAFGGERVRMARHRVDDYVALIQQTAEEVAPLGIEVLCGIEAEVFPDEIHLQPMDSILSQYPFDFVLGSLHAQCQSYLQWLEQHEVRDDAAIIDHYFRHLIEGVRSGRYDSMSHPDVIRTYGVVSRFAPQEHEPVIRQFLTALVEEDVCMEVNTSGLTKGDFEVHPDPIILDWAAEAGVKLTVGSDSHRPLNVGQFFPTVLPMLKQKGFQELHYFRQRKRHVIPNNGVHDATA